MKLNTILISLFIFLFLPSCKDKTYDEGIITYQIDYPNNKDNFFLYHVLPKELITSFKNDKMELKIKKANMENTIIIDSKNQNIAAYYDYGDKYTCYLTAEEQKKVLSKQPKYTYTFLKEKDTLLGFNIKKAIATDPNKPKEKIAIWYTEEIKIKNPNWFNGFGKIPGVMLKYQVYQYGLKMDFVARKFQEAEINDSLVSLIRPGKNLSHFKFDSIIVNLFDSFK